MSAAWANLAENAVISGRLRFWDHLKTIVSRIHLFHPSKFDPVRRYYPLALFPTKADKVNGREAADGLLANPVRSERKQP